MGRQTTRLQVSGYRFTMRRLAHALVRADVRMIDDPLRAQSVSLTAGCVIAAVALGACGVMAVLRPQGVPGDAPIVRDRVSGALHVRIGETLHPVPNLASARLITGSPAEPKTVGPSALAGLPRGPMVGIPGAPAAVGAPISAGESTWTVCDTAMATTVLVGPRPAESEPDAALLVVARSEGPAMTYLLYGGRRAAVDLRDPAVVRALRVEGVVPRPVSRVLLDAVPESPPITAPRIADAGAPGVLPGRPVGTVVRVARGGGSEFFVVLADGLQRIGEVTADLIRFTVRQPHGEVPDVAPDVLADAGIVDPLPVATFPARIAIADPVVPCVHWTAGQGRSAAVLGDGRELLAAPGTVELAQADGAAPNIDAVRVPAGRSAYLRPVSATGAGGSAEPRLLLTDSGVLFGVPDDDTAGSLGIAEAPLPAPWPVLARLPRGPELSRESASVVRDAVPGVPTAPAAP
ncbi:MULTISPECIES: type VII secretion protein EccB [Mycobacteriaceae]|uniref:type VII secretion protein EccB n=1 Tax=Mycobacteriaceae TaxID=1762 RepID=UPI0007FD4EB8|nr:MULTISPECIES: type VII secretion protein EccB [Mycobacteriaceae]MCK0173631.1 type VII secretion protein EccB [Mycolicibacterium sp. F2034L]OBB57282.1 type VII secretion protein EccB [Mycobacterium sp. 852013-51886_SCH5428379]